MHAADSRPPQPSRDFAPGFLSPNAIFKSSMLQRFEWFLIPLAVLLATACQPATSPAETPDPVLLTLQEARTSFQSAEVPARSEDPRAAQSLQALQAGQFEQARQSLEAWAQQTSSGEPAFLLGWLHHKDGRFQLALPWLAQALAAGPTYPRADQIFFLYGRCLQESGHLAGARAAYLIDQELFPAGGDAPFRLALMEFEAGQLDECERLLTLALKRFDTPRDQAKAHARLADVHCARGDWELGRQSLESCVALFPHYEAFYKLARIYERQGDTEAAQANHALHREWRERITTQSVPR